MPLIKTYTIIIIVLKHFTCRNPDPSCRPKFIELEIQLRQSNEDLLSVHVNAHQLGGDPEGSSLYTDLQNVYKENPN